MKRYKEVQGNINLPAVECINAKANRWKVRWDITPSGEGMATWSEIDIGHRPTVEDIAEIAYAYGINDSELRELSALMGYGDAEVFMEDLEAAKASLTASDPMRQLMEVVREQHVADTAIPSGMALRIPAMFHTFQELCHRGKQLEKGVVLRYRDVLWRVVQTHTPMDIYPPSIDTASLYTRVEPEHSGTLEDPIPYEQGMAFESGKYYEQFGVVYVCILTTQTGYPNDLKDLPTIVKPV